MALKFADEVKTFETTEYSENIEETEAVDQSEPTESDNDPFLDAYNQPMPEVEREEYTETEPHPTTSKGKQEPSKPASLFVIQLANNAQNMLFSKIASEDKEDVFKLSPEAETEIAHAYDKAYPNIAFNISPKTNFWILVGKHLGSNVSKALNVRKKNKKIKHLKEQLRTLKMEQKIKDMQVKVNSYDQSSDIKTD